MSDEVFTARAPGKIFLVGEYSVLDGKPAFLIAVDKYVVASFQPGDSSPSEGELVDSALDTVYSYLSEGAVQVRKGSVKIQNGLVDEEGRKLGLGSSGAICVAVIKAVLKAHGITPSISLLFRLGAIAECRVQPGGSFGDVVSAACGGFIEYNPIESDWLAPRIVTEPVRQLVESKWPESTAVRYPWAEDLIPVLGWTGAPVSTPSLIRKYQSAKSKRKKDFTGFLEEYEEAVARPMERALDRGDTTRFKELVRQDRILVKRMSDSLGLGLMTPTLNKLVKAAESCGATAKPTGSWGGDCGIALCDTPEQVDRVCSAWEKAGIVPVRIDIAPEEE